MRRLPIGALALAALLLPAAVGASPAGAEASPRGAAPTASREVPAGMPSQGVAAGGRVEVVQVSGLLDPILASFVERSIEGAEQRRADWLVLQVNSRATVVSRQRVAELVEAVRTSTVQVAVWVGPSGARAYEGMGQVAAMADEVGVAIGSRIGRFGEPVVDEARFPARSRSALDELADETAGPTRANELGVAAVDIQQASYLGGFLIQLEGVPTEMVEVDGRQRPQFDGRAVFRKLALVDQMMHTVASPPVTYLLLLVAIALLLLELYTAGIGVAGVVGAGSLVLACYGLAVLPVRPVALALFALAAFGFAVDVQTGVPRAWSAIATASVVAGSFLLYDGLSLSWIALLVGVVGLPLYMVAGLPSLVRTRFSTPTIGRQWMIGEEGEAVAAVDPEGVVRLRGGLWRARTNRATPVPVGGGIRVVEVQGLLLEVEPLEGGAVDYRERRSDAEPE